MEVASAAITGVGILSPLGVGSQTFWENLAAGKSGIEKSQRFHCTAAPGEYVGEVREFTEESARKVFLKPQRKSIKLMCHEIQLGVASANLAVEEAGLVLDEKGALATEQNGVELDRNRVGVAYGANLMLSLPTKLTDGIKVSMTESGEFSIPGWGANGLGKMDPLWLLQILPNMPACHIGITFDARGPNNSLTLDETTGCSAMTESLSVIRRKWADIMLTGTTGTRLHEVKSMHTRMWYQVAFDPDDPTHSCRPFDVRRNGQTMAEGACTMVFENEAHAKARGAKILAHMLGGRSTSVCSRTGEVDLQQAAVNAMRGAMRTAGVTPADIGHINAHGLGTWDSDLAEARAIHEAFGALGSKVPVTALKGALGNSGASCGTLETAGSIIGLSHGMIPPTVGCDQPDPACNLNIVRKTTPTDNKLFLKLNFCHTGQASAVVIRGA